MSGDVPEPDVIVSDIAVAPGAAVSDDVGSLPDVPDIPGSGPPVALAMSEPLPVAIVSVPWPEALPPSADMVPLDTPAPRGDILQNASRFPTGLPAGDV